MTTVFITHQFEIPLSASDALKEINLMPPLQQKMHLLSLAEESGSPLNETVRLLDCGHLYRVQEA